MERKMTADVDNDDSDDEEKGKKYHPFTATDVQKIRLEKLMANIDKPMEIPVGPKSKKFATPPEFVRNVMGSSAGAGSGEFHVYRHLRRKEYARLNFIETQAKNEQLDEEYRKKLEENQRKLEESTAKRRAKRLKKKERLKAKKKMRPNDDDDCKPNSNADNDKNDDDSADSNDD
ncbi:PRKR-interacting protein 1 homolog [Dermatophagoides pteronyssinus]|uniref:PRKR-interacting protein 1 homolog n=1 Tax=Dermatophagoides pteronyssinus TaxID=6956 RepID=UPI003F67E2C5